jgi:hypothetical protein
MPVADTGPTLRLGRSLMRVVGVFVALCVVTLAASGCGGSGQGGEDQGGEDHCSISGLIEWKGQLYDGAGAFYAPALTTGPLTPVGRKSTCDGKEPVRVWRISGVDPAIAFSEAKIGAGDKYDLAGGKGAPFYLVRGVFVALPSHPLHLAFYRTAAEPYRVGDHHRCVQQGRVTGSGNGSFVVRAPDGRKIRTIVDARTTITGAQQRGDQPFLRDGATVHVSARRCASRSSRVGDDQMTAVKITVLG